KKMPSGTTVKRVVSKARGFVDSLYLYKQIDLLSMALNLKKLSRRRFMTEILPPDLLCLQIPDRPLLILLRMGNRFNRFFKCHLLLVHEGLDQINGPVKCIHR